ncbi:MAG: hypothetical protein IKP42_03285 [Ruminococcus sp.]|nr:hypothetical protein [Ruminococcus sp.]
MEYGVDIMGSFLDTIKKVENQYGDGVLVGEYEQLEETKPACEEFICKHVEEVKNQLLKNAESQFKVYNEKTILGKKIKTSPIYAASLFFNCCYEPYYAHFEESSYSEPYSDYPTGCYSTHSPEMVNYFISEICRRLSAEGITPFEWKKSGKQYSGDKKHVSTSYPNTEQKDRIKTTYKEMHKAIKKKEFVKVKNKQFHFNISMAFMVEADK